MPDSRFEPDPDGGIDVDSISFVGRDWRSYVRSYRLAADVLYRQATADTILRDPLLFPLLFSARHYLEVAFKEQLLLTAEILDAERRVPPQHQLWPLWATLRPRVLELMQHESEKLDLEPISRIVRRIESLDRGSFAFRYPVSTRADPSLPHDLRLVDLSVFWTEFEPAADLLDLIGNWVRSLLDYVRENA